MFKVTEFDLSGACAALLVAVRDALHVEVCKGRFPCLKKNKFPRENLRGAIRRFWQIVPEDFRERTFQRLQMYRFAFTHQYETITWKQFLYYMDESTMLGLSFQEQFDNWQDKQKAARPEKTIYRILLAKTALSLEGATYILESLPRSVQDTIGRLLLKELNRVCRASFFSPAHTREQSLELQFDPPHGPTLYRPLVPSFQV
jgi:hypothetical protein